MELVIIGIAVLTMFVAQRVEHRLGAAAAGWFATLPIAFAVAAVSIAIVNSPVDAATAAFSAAGHIAPMITYAVTFTITAPRWGAIRGFIAATVAYVTASLLLIPLPSVGRIVLGIIAIAVGSVFMGRRPAPSEPLQAASPTQQRLSLVSGAVVVAGISLANKLAGPELAGAVAAYPVMTTTLALFIAHRSGPVQATEALRGLVGSVPIYLVYCLAFAVTVTRTPPLVAMLLATIAALATAAVTWRRVAGNINAEP